MTRATLLAGLFILAAALAGCDRAENKPANATPLWEGAYPATISQYGLFAGDMLDQRPAKGVVPYDVNSPLFSDYAEKHRFLKLPPGGKVKYDPVDVFDLPVGTILAKTFAFPHDRRDPKAGQRIIETRILMHRAEGWIGLPYLWNEEQTEATLKLAGATIDVAWIHDDGAKRTNNYIIPNANQCKGCHSSREEMVPIGLKARHLNRDYVYEDGEGQPVTENQLDHWSRIGALAGAPNSKDAPRLPVWDDPKTGTVAERARAWLEINCAHCHNPLGPASNSALDLTASQSEPIKYGVHKPPVAAGQGSGGFRFAIVPGKPDESILVYRISSTEPQAMMPELGKRLVHREAVELIRRWIAEMEPADEPAVR